MTEPTDFEVEAALEAITAPGEKYYPFDDEWLRDALYTHEDDFIALIRTHKDPAKHAELGAKMVALVRSHAERHAKSAAIERVRNDHEIDKREREAMR